MIDEIERRKSWEAQLRQDGQASAEQIARSAAHALTLRDQRIEALEARLREYVEWEQKVGRLLTACAPFTREPTTFACPLCRSKANFAEGTIEHAAGCAGVALRDAVRAVKHA